MESQVLKSDQAKIYQDSAGYLSGRLRGYLILKKEMRESGKYLPSLDFSHPYFLS